VDTVDVHSHFFPQPFLRLIRSHGSPHGASIDRRDGVEWLTMPGHPPVPLAPLFVDVDARRASLAQAGITAQALSLSPPMVYWAPPDLGVALARAFNDGIAELAQSYPGQFVGLATLPLQDVPAALREMERAAALQLRGVYVATTVRGRYLDAPEFAPLWELAVALDLPVFIHPQTHLGADVLAHCHLFNTVGFPVETAVLAARLIYAGTFDRHPSLRVVLAHAGGVLPMLLGRLDHAHRQRAECRRAIQAPPSTYLRHFYFDTVTHDDVTLRFLVQRVGTQRVVLGSDAPYDMADEGPVARVRRLRLRREATVSILGRTARRLLHWELKPVVQEG
jgi:aminocarboxymuconate-semialdehyde decarboxylase